MLSTESLYNFRWPIKLQRGPLTIPMNWITYVHTSVKSFQ